MNAALELEMVSKRYHRRTSIRGILTEVAGLAEGSDAFWALRDVSFSLVRGESFGVVGHNGAGKSTLLKILSRITPPTTGRFRIFGRLGSLIEVGAGFHPELTGRENIFLASSIQGMRRREVAKKFDAIVEFSELREFLDMPVKRYSSGMFVRLGLSVAVHAQPDVLLVDEVLAVGDRAFRSKCLDYFSELRTRGCTILLVSHHLDLIQRLCDRACLLEHGRITNQGEAGAVLDSYRTVEFERPHRPSAKIGVEFDDVCIEALEVLNEKGSLASTVEMGRPLTFRMHYRVHRPVPQAVFVVEIDDQEGTRVTTLRNDLQDGDLPYLQQGFDHVDVHINSINLLPGHYKANASILDGRNKAIRCCRQSAAKIQVLGCYVAKGFCHLPHIWSGPKADS